MSRLDLTCQDRTITSQSGELLRPDVFKISYSRGVQLCNLFKDSFSHQAVWKGNEVFRISISQLLILLLYSVLGK